MAKLTEYPKAKKFDKNDILIKDGTAGTHKITVEDAAAEFGAMLADETLSEAGKLAPADAVGEELKKLSEEIESRAAIPSNVYVATIAEFSDGADNRPLTALSVGIEAIQKGSGDPSPENIRAISGWTGTKIRRTGKNLWGGDAVLEDISSADPNAKDHEKDSSVPPRAIRFTRPIGVGSYSVFGYYPDRDLYNFKFKEKTSYTFIITFEKDSGIGSNLVVRYTDDTTDAIPSVTAAGVKETKILVTNANKTILDLRTVYNSGKTTLYADECGLFEGVVTEEEFEPYRGEEVAVDWEAAAGTVYGGTLNVLTGELSVTHRKFTITNIMGFLATGSIERAGVALIGGYGSIYANASRNCCNMLVVHKGSLARFPDGTYRLENSTNYMQAIVYFRLPGVEMTVEAYNAKLAELSEAGTPLEFIVEMATPTVYQLTPAQMTTLLGENRVWADSGDVELGYMINTKSYIDEGDARGIEHTDASVLSAMKNIAEIPPVTSASKSYAVGEFVIIDSDLYKVTSAIAIGETFQPGVNIAVTTVGEELSSAHAEFVDREEKVAEELKIYAQIADRTYAGRDLTAVFASEIAQAGNDPWAWIKSRITAQNYEGIHVGDYIPWTDTTSAGTTRNAYILGINTYRQYGYPAVGHHIDFYGGLWGTKRSINTVDYNNGTSESEHPWLASDAYLYVNSLAGKVPSTETANPTLVDVDYTADGIYYYLPDALKAQIKPKRAYLEKRYIEGELLTESNAGAMTDIGNIWFPTEYEVYGAPVWGGGKFAGIGSAVQYPFFTGNMNRMAFGRQLWWLLTPRFGNSTTWCNVTDHGLANGNAKSSVLIRVPICFRIA